MSSFISLPVLKRFARMLWSGLLEILYPTQCIGCGVSTSSDSDPLCHRCCRDLERVSPEETATRITALSESSPSLDRGFSLWTFDKGGILQKVQHVLKYGNRPTYGLFLGELMGRVYIETICPSDRPDLVIPIPLHRSRYYERGYNQSTMLGRGFARALDIPIDDRTLVRTRVTQSQTQLSRRERWKNVEGAFEVQNPDVVSGRAIILIDDVLTTGSTAASAARALRKADARSVSLATLAMARG